MGRIWPGCGHRGSRPGGGWEGLQATTRSGPARGGRRGVPRTPLPPSAAVPAAPPGSAIKRLGPDQLRRSEASDAASGRSRPGIYRNKRVGATRPRHGHDGDLRLGECLWTGRSSGAYDLPSNAVGTPCSAWHPAQDAMRNGEAGCESQPQRSHGSIGRLGTIGYPTSDSH